MKITKEVLKRIVEESIQEEMSAGMKAIANGPTHNGPAYQPKISRGMEALSGPTYTAPQMSQAASDALSGPTYTAPEQLKKDDSQINKNVVVNIRKNLEKLMGEIDKALASMK